ncbi:SDR family oxidoreductase [Rubinisphaera margarita]|uniref:SDR family oxidoreductase n=1 Tax=Rubinisphaera margarita TaxID=2909586 RepID=UPI001EE957D0|nr:SDR family oxidoreductase [Rubinisphaera margarita]MCG6156193.1 SDR family oxidoreductase [Rubinisphaera margarita]
MSDKSASYLQQLFGLDGKTAVVIGGTGVLGGAICDCLAAAGAYVIVAGRSEESGNARVEALKEAGGAGEFAAVDVSSRESVQALLDQCVSSGHAPDILVNGAGVNAATPFLDIPDEEWDRIFNINLGSVRVASQTFAKHWLDEDRQGSIINIASMSALIPLSRVFTYSASKAAVLNLTKNLAREWAEQGIRVNAISPGFFPAEQNKKVLTPDRVSSIMKHTPANRFGEPQELAGAVLLLASDHAGSFITGENLVVDGGFSSMTI